MEIKSSNNWNMFLFRFFSLSSFLSCLYRLPPGKSVATRRWTTSSLRSSPFLQSVGWKFSSPWMPRSKAWQRKHGIAALLQHSTCSETNPFSQINFCNLLGKWLAVTHVCQEISLSHKTSAKRADFPSVRMSWFSPVILEALPLRRMEKIGELGMVASPYEKPKPTG